MDLSDKTLEQLETILYRTTYADQGVAVGKPASADQDLRRAAMAEVERRLYGDA